MISPDKLDILQRSWVHLLSQFQIGPAEAYPLFDRLTSAYQEPHRHYHNLEHIAEMLKVAGKLSDQAKNVLAIQLAIWFHDAIYDPKAKDNEEQSAQLAIRELQALRVPDSAVNEIAAMIRATAHTESTSMDPDIAILLDADLAILGAEESRYRRYAAAIRREYSWAEEPAYREGRKRVLESFLKRPAIYRTARMHEVGDVPARRNLQAEIERLS
jgi:predicted metal-dependent HD superfamily phosphohydrolase